MGIEILAGLLEPIHSQNRVSLEVGIPAWPIGIASVPAPRPIRANLRCYREAAIHGKDVVPLPAPNQLLHQAARSAAERFAVPERQLIAEVGAELVQQAEGSGPLVEVPVKSVHGCGILIICAIDEVRGVDVQHLSPCIAGLERQPAARALEQGEIHRMVATGADIEPALGGAEQRVGTRVWTTVPPRDILRSLRDPAWNSAWVLWKTRGSGRKRSAGKAARWVVALQGLNRIHVHCCRNVIRLAAHILRLGHE